MVSLPMISYLELSGLLGTPLESFRAGFFGGSRVICDPAPTDTDRDIVIHVEDVEYAVETLVKYGWKTPNETKAEYEGEYGDFQTMRRGEDNIMLFSDPYEFGAVWGATCAAKKMNLLEKKDRYALFEAARSPWRD